MARRFAKVSEEEIVAINEAALFYPSELTPSADSSEISTLATLHAFLTALIKRVVSNVKYKYFRARQTIIYGFR